MPGPFDTLSDADLWEHYRDAGLSAEDATHHVQLRSLAQQGPAISDQEKADVQNVGPLATAAQNALEWSPAAVASLPHALLKLATPPDTPGSWHMLSSHKGLADFVPPDPMGSLEAKAAGLSYTDFQKAKGVSDEANPTAALVGKAGGLATGPVAAIGAKLGRMTQVAGATKAAALEGQQLRNTQLRQAIAERSAPAEAPRMPSMDWQPPVEPVNAETQQAIADFNAGKITGEDLRYQMDVAAGRTPAPMSRVAPTVPESPPAAPSALPVVPQAAVPPQGATTPAVTGGLPLPGSPKGMTAIGPPTPPVPTTPTVTEILEGKGSMVPQATTDVLQTRMGEATIPGRPDLGINSPPGPYQRAAPAMRSLSSPTGAQAADLAKMTTASQGLAEALGQAPKVEPFTGAGFTGASRVMQSPLYRQAGSLARQFLKDPSLTAQFPEFAGMDEAALTKALRTLLMEQGQGGASAPALTSLPKFLQRLKPAGAR
jgi:hypothetical protein